MCVRIAPLSNFWQVVDTISDWERTNDQIRIPHEFPSEIESEAIFKKPLKIPDDGNGILKKKDKEDVPIYYFVYEFSTRKRKAK